jgi:large subunit ribosomal protein L24
MHVKKGDTVVVIAGKERGMKGQVLKVLRDDDKVVVEGRNLVKRHHKPNPLIGREGGIIER